MLLQMLPPTNLLNNLSSSRHRPPTLTTRSEEGWTEVWGGKDIQITSSTSGNKTNDNQQGDNLPLPPRYVTVLKDGCDYIADAATAAIGSGSSTTDCNASTGITSPLLKLSQHRTAWYEQIILRMCRIPHAVTNSGYAACESTGGLPCLLDLSGGRSGWTTGTATTTTTTSTATTAKESSYSRQEEELVAVLGNKKQQPILVGRNHPGGLGSSFFHQLHHRRIDGVGLNNRRGQTPQQQQQQQNQQKQLSFLSSGSHIVDYLRLQHSHRVQQFMIFPEHDATVVNDDGSNGDNKSNSRNSSSHSAADAMAYSTLIQEKLNYILLALRYGNDPAWEGVYRHQCIRASLDPDGLLHHCGGGSSRTRSSSSSMSFGNNDNGQTAPTATATATAAHTPFTTTTASSQIKPIKQFFSLWSWYQAFSERKLALHTLLPSSSSCCSTQGDFLACELFRYNDYRYGTHFLSKVSDNECGDGNGGGNEEEVRKRGEQTTMMHQHHPWSSFLQSSGGVGGGGSGKVNVYRAMEYADIYYTSLESKLASFSAGTDTDTNDDDDDDDDAASTPSTTKRANYFLGTSKPTYIDALLFAHLAEALCDVHLILVLAKHARLMRYFQWMYDEYFGEEYAKSYNQDGSTGGVGDLDWITNNNLANSRNAFNQIPEPSPLNSKSTPLLDDGRNDEGNKNTMIHAVQLMQKLAIHCRQLDEAMRDAARLRAAAGNERAVLERYHRPIGSRLYQWIMGSDVEFWGSGSQSKIETASSDETNTNDTSSNAGDGEDGGEESESSTSKAKDNQRVWRERMEQMKRDRRTHDELWLSGVVVTVVVAMVLSASDRSNR